MHFPELLGICDIVNDNYMYARCLLMIKRRESLSEESLPALGAIVMDETKAQAILDAARHSMGMDINDVDLSNVHAFAERIIRLAEYRLRPRVCELRPLILRRAVCDRAHT